MFRIIVDNVYVRSRKQTTNQESERQMTTETKKTIAESVNDAWKNWAANNQKENIRIVNAYLAEKRISGLEKARKRLAASMAQKLGVSFNDAVTCVFFFAD